MIQSVKLKPPSQVFQSSMHMANSCFWYCSLHKQTEAEVLDYTLIQGEDMMAAYCKQRHLIPPGDPIPHAMSSRATRGPLELSSA